MTGFELRTSGVRSNRATTTARQNNYIKCCFKERFWRFWSISEPFPRNFLSYKIYLLRKTTTARSTVPTLLFFSLSLSLSFMCEDVYKVCIEAFSTHFRQFNNLSSKRNIWDPWLPEKKNFDWRFLVATKYQSGLSWTSYFRYSWSFLKL